MSKQNIVVVRRVMDAMSQGDGVAIGRFAHAEYEFRTTSELPGGGVHRGLEEVTAFAREFSDTWETLSIEEEQVIDADETVVVLGRLKAKGKLSGLALDTAIAYVHFLREGKLVRTEVFLHRDDAMKAAGLLG